MKQKRVFSILFLIVFVSISVVFLPTCKKGEDKVSTEKIIKIGSILSLTGDAASYGVVMKRGIMMATEKANSEKLLGENVKIEPFFEDSALVPKKGISAYRKLISIEKVDAICSITGSIVALSVAPLTKSDKIIIMDALSSSPKLTGVSPHYFRIMPSDTFAGRELSMWAIEKGYKKGVIAYMNNDWGNEIRKFTKENFEKMDGKILEEEAVNAGDSDFKNIISKMKEKQPDVTFLYLFGKEAGILVKQARNAKFSTIFMGSDNLSAKEFSSAGADVIENVMYVMPSSEEKDELTLFKEKYLEKYGENPDINSIKPYDAMMLLIYGIKSTGSTEADMLKEFFISMDKYSGISGDIKFDKNGDLVSQKYDRLIYKNGKGERIIEN